MVESDSVSEEARVWWFGRKGKGEMGGYGSGGGEVWSWEKCEWLAVAVVDGMGCSCCRPNWKNVGGWGCEYWAMLVLVCREVWLIENGSQEWKV